MQRILFSAASRSEGFQVIEEVEEGRTERQQPAVQRDAVRGRRHRVFAHAVVDVAAAVRAGLEITEAFEVVLVDGSRSAEPPTSSGSAWR